MEHRVFISWNYDTYIITQLGNIVIINSCQMLMMVKYRIKY